MRRICIIGASAAGVTAAKSARASDPDCTIEILSREPHLPYYRPFLSEYIGDDGVEGKSGFLLHPATWYEEQGITLRLGVEAVAISSTDRTVTDAAGGIHPYDRLIIATGAEPFVPIKGALEHDNVFVVRSLDDARRVHAAGSEVASVAVVGGGLLGLEAAWSLRKRGLNVTVLELAPRLLPLQLDEEGSALLEAAVTAQGIEVMTGVATEAIDDGGVVRLKDRDPLTAQMVLVCIGAIPNVALARDAGLQVERGIVVDETMRTSDPAIYACGDVAQYMRATPLWMRAVKQGTVAGTNAAGGDASFANQLYPAALDAFGLKVLSHGAVTGEGVTAWSSKAGDKVRKLFFQEENTVGGILINDPKNTMKVMNAVRDSIERAAGITLFEE